MDDPRIERIFAIARGSGKTSMTYRLCEAMIRADVYQHYDPMTRTLHFASMNQEAPLTDEEKTAIVNHLGIHMLPYEVVFDN